ncbi:MULTISPECIES: hypothetical protein [unclassified Streptomyces]|uniref:hypothetical protein n=1 Tax=Streptomyces sp. NPDC006678 TaxID=3157185 RepID=UPI0033F5C26B
MNQRLTGLTLAAVCAALLPLAASAGPADTPEPGTPDGKRAGTPAILAGMHVPHDPEKAPDAAVEAIRGRRTSEHCGPEVTSPAGVEAQTCVLTEGSDVWARTYFRNGTGDELMSVLSLMGPGDRTVRTHCAIEAGDEPAACETPREKALGEADAYSAVAEFARSGGDADSPLLLRSGSNSPDAGGS